MKSRDQVTFSPTSCRQTNDGSERTLKEIITTQLAPLVCKVYLVFQTPFVSLPFSKIKLLYSNVVIGGKVEHSAAHAVYDTARHLL